MEAKDLSFEEAYILASAIVDVKISSVSRSAAHSESRDRFEPAVLETVA